MTLHLVGKAARTVDVHYVGDGVSRAAVKASLEARESGVGSGDDVELSVGIESDVRELHAATRLGEVADGLAARTGGVKAVDDYHVVLGVESLWEVEKDKVVYVNSSGKMLWQNTDLSIVSRNVKLDHTLVDRRIPWGCCHTVDVQRIFVMRKTVKRKSRQSMDRVALLELQIANRNRMLIQLSKMFSIHLDVVYDSNPNEHCICDMGLCCDSCARCRADELVRLRVTNSGAGNGK